MAHYDINTLWSIAMLATIEFYNNIIHKYDINHDVGELLYEVYDDVLTNGCDENDYIDLCNIIEDKFGVIQDYNLPLRNIISVFTIADTENVHLHFLEQLDNIHNHIIAYNINCELNFDIIYHKLRYYLLNVNNYDLANKPEFEFIIIEAIGESGYRKYYDIFSTNNTLNNDMYILFIIFIYYNVYTYGKVS